MDVLTMPAGRELDALVAAHVMGWRQLELRPVQSTVGTGERSDATPQLLGRDPRTSVGGGHSQRVPRYSADESLPLQEELQARGWYISTSGLSRGALPRVTVVVTIPSGRKFQGTAETRSLALCRAALSAVQSLNPVGAGLIAVPPVRTQSGSGIPHVRQPRLAESPAGTNGMEAHVGERFEPLDVPQLPMPRPSGADRDGIRPADRGEGGDSGRVVAAATTTALRRIGYAAASALHRVREVLPGSIPVRRAGSDAESRLDRELLAVEREAETAAGSEQAEILVRGAELCFDAREHTRALTYYGRAVDAYLGAHHFDAAADLCLRMIDISPKVVRARGTLAFLALGKGIFFHPLDEQWKAALREIG